MDPTSQGLDQDQFRSASKGDPSKARVEGVMRDEEGNCLPCFTQNVSYATNNQA